MHDEPPGKGYTGAEHYIDKESELHAISLFRSLTKQKIKQLLDLYSMMSIFHFHDLFRVFRIF